MAGKKGSPWKQARDKGLQSAKPKPKKKTKKKTDE